MNTPRREPCVITTLTRKPRGIQEPPRKDVRRSPFILQKQTVWLMLHATQSSSRIEEDYTMKRKARTKAVFVEDLAFFCFLLEARIMPCRTAQL